MLIIKLIDKKDDTRNYFMKLLLGKKNEVTRDHKVISNKHFDIISTTYDDLTSSDIQRLLRMNKGKVLESLNFDLNDLLCEYLFDKNSYIKRAILSSVKNFIKQSCGQISVIVYERCFLTCKEYYSLAESVKGFTLITEKTSITDSFVEEIYYELGLKVVVQQKNISSECDLIIDFSRIEKDGSLFVNFRGDNVLIYPDNSYFEPDDEVLALIECGVPIKCACAVMRDV